MNKLKLTKSRRKMVWIVILACVAIPLAVIAWQIDDWSRDWTTNHASLEPAATNPQLRPPEFDQAATEVEQRVRQWVESQPHWQVESTRVQDATVEGSNAEGSNAEGTTVQLHLTRTTSLFRFTDDIQVEISPLESESGRPRCRLSATSRSRVGKGDLGQNPRNLIELVRGVGAS